MKTLITLFTATAVVAGATSAMAVDFQASSEATGADLSWQVVRNPGGAYASARVPARSHATQAAAPAGLTPGEKQMIWFQAH